MDRNMDGSSDLEGLEMSKKMKEPLIHVLNGASLIDWVCTLEGDICAKYPREATRRVVVVTGTDQDIYKILSEETFRERCCDLELEIVLRFPLTIDLRRLIVANLGLKRDTRNEQARVKSLNDGMRTAI